MENRIEALTSILWLCVDNHIPYSSEVPDKLTETHWKNWCLAAFFVLLLAARLCHLHILWAEEGYGGAGAVQILQGKALYRDIWFDKPPLAAWLYVLWGAFPGWPLRIAGTVLAWLTCFVALLAGERLWSGREGLWAAAAIVFFLIFDTPTAVMTWAPDLMTVPLSLAAVATVGSGGFWWAGFCCALALHANAKGILILALVLVWAGRKSPIVLASFLIWFGAGLGLLALTGSLGAYWHQVWEAGRLYAGDTFVANPIREGALRSAHWLGFHAALVIAAVVGWYSISSRKTKLLFLLWVAVGAANVVGGERFFPRYYLALLPPAVLLAGRGITSLMDAPGWLRSPFRMAVLVAMVIAALIPAVRFGPRYFRLAADVVMGRPSHWADVALNEDSQRVSEDILSQVVTRGTTRGSRHQNVAKANVQFRLAVADPRATGSSNTSGPTLAGTGFSDWFLPASGGGVPQRVALSSNGGTGKTDLLVWGYRPDIFVYTRLPAATRFLDSQMLTGVLADRHLTQTHLSIEEAVANRAALVKSHPAVIVDGLGPLNPKLGIEQYPELQGWLSGGYDMVFQTRYTRVYERK